MFDIGWIEMAVIALIALVVIGPKELPKAMRSLAKWTRKARSMAREFQSGIDDMVRDADLDDARKAVESAKSFNIGKTLEETIDPTGGLRDEASELEAEMAREAAEEDAGDRAEAPDAAGNDAGDVAGDDGAKEPGAAGTDAGDDGVKEPGAAGTDAGDDGAKEPAAAGNDAGDDGVKEPGAAEGATVIEHPLNIAPPDSLTPPPEPEAASPTPEPAAAAADGVGSKQRA